MRNVTRTLALAALAGGLPLAGATVVGAQGSPPGAAQGTNGTREPRGNAAQPGATGQGSSRATAGAPALGRQVAELIGVTASVESIDRKSRKVTLKDPDGKRLTVQVPEEMRGFDRIKKGDNVDVTFYQSMALAFLPAEVEPPVVEERQIDVGGGVMAREITAAMAITKVDARNNMVSAKAPDGTAVTVKVQDPALVPKLRTLKPGDVVQLDYTEAVATKIEPHTAK
jgi:hypothetical protein